MMGKRIFIAISTVLLMVSCFEEQDFEEITPASGEDVRFAAKVSNPETKTLYGEIDGNAVKIKWVHDDKISVYGTTCVEGRQQAEYAVKTYAKNQDGTVNTGSIVTATPNSGDGQNYADDLVKTGSYGVQWGTEQFCDFYAIYPSVNDNAFSLSADKKSAVVRSAVSTVQYLSFQNNSTTLRGIPYDNSLKKYGMDNAIMYAATAGQQNSENTIVDLAFKPFSTVIKFTIPTWVGNTSSGLAQEQTGKSIIVKSIALTAPQMVFGEFDLQINSDGTAGVKSSTTGTSKTVTIIPSEQLRWTYGQELEFSVFAIPLENVPMTGWKVAIDFTVTTTSNGQSEAMDIRKSFTFGESNKNLVAGYIHNVRLAKGFPVDAVWTYSPDSWLETVPRNVYISDLSLPGSWYATDSGYQTASLQEQYSVGIRSFNIDTRLTISSGENVRDYRGNTSSLSPEYQDDFTHLTNGVLVLACAGTENHYEGIAGAPDGRITSIGKNVKEALIELGQLAANNPNEYIEVILTIAQKPKDYDYLNNWRYVYGTVNPQMMLTAISNVLNDPEVKPYLFGGNSGEILTPNTTLNDVKGKMLVKVNLNTSDAKIQEWNISGPFLISEGSMSESADANKHITQANFIDMNECSMYWSNTYIKGYVGEGENLQPTHTDGAMYFYYHQAQNTTGSGNYPDVTERKQAILDIISNSYDIYHNDTHDGMFQLGIGGWTSDGSSGKTNLSSQLKPYVYGIINSMLTKTTFDPGDGQGARVFEPAPVGSVLMNHSNAGTTHDTQKLIDAIIELNGTYFLNRDENAPEWPETTGNADVSDWEDESLN